MKNLMNKMVGTAAALTFGLVAQADAQNMYTDYEDNQESTKIGITAAINGNFGALGYQNNLAGQGQNNFVNFNRTDGFGAGFYGGLFGEYDSGDWWGAQLRVNYDNRFVSVTNNAVSPGVTSQYDANVEYVTIEPLLQIRDVFVNDFYLQAGPVIAFNVGTSMDYYADNNAPADISNYEPSGIQQTVFGVQGGLAYDVELGDSNDGQAFVFTPFVEGSWLVNQREDGLPGRDENDFDDTWSTPTLRAGIQFSSMFLDAQPMDFGEIDFEIDEIEPVSLSVNTPYQGVVKARYVEEDFPLATAVFFEEGSDMIPNRYEKLTRAQAANFSENKIIAPRELGTHSMKEIKEHSMEVYYNVVNIFADRLRKNPETTVTLVGGAPLETDGHQLAKSVKTYLTDVFGINSNRIMTKGKVIPPEASGTKDTPQKDMAMVRDENRKVEFIFSNPYMESPVVMKKLIESPIDHDVVFTLDENEADVNSWNIYIEGNGKTLSYGPFYGSTVRVDPNVLLSDEEDGFYRARAVVNTEAGRTVSDIKSFTLQREVMDENEVMGERFALLFDFDENDPDNIPFEEFLLTEVIPSIESDERVIVHGHTDGVGLADYNYELSLQRAQQVKTIIERELSKKNVNAQVDAIGFGESDMRVTFDNSLPEGRYYNRNVIIEIIPNSDMSLR